MAFSLTLSFFVFQGAILAFFWNLNLKDNPEMDLSGAVPSVFAFVPPVRQAPLIALSVVTLALSGSLYAMPIVTPAGVKGLVLADGSVYNVAIGDGDESQVFSQYNLPLAPALNPVLVEINTLLVALFNSLSLAPT